MKVAVLSLPLRNNYGGVMQAYALQRVINKLGHEAVLLNNGHLSSKQGFGLILSLIKDKIKNYKSLDCKFENFILNEMSLSKPIVGRKDFYRKDIKCFDAFVVGSDQVWRKSYARSYQEYFLRFVNDDAKKISYAASFGVYEFDQEDELVEINRLLRRFDSISVREEEGVQVLQEKMMLESTLVLDPTLLLTKDEYVALIDKRGGEKNCENKVFSYLLDSSPEKLDLCRNISERLNLDLDILDVSEQYIGIEDWLSCFNTADFIITDSFHGVAFSIIFNKPFIALGNVSRGISRFTTILGCVGLNDNLVTDLSKFNFEEIVTNIDYREVDFYLDILKEKSIGFLTRSLNRKD